MNPVPNPPARRRSVKTVAAIIIGNLIPVAGVLFLGWSAGQILVLYWIETVVVGLLTLPRILTAQGPINERAVFSGTSIPYRVLIAAFFVVHFGAFCAMQGFFAAMLTTMAESGFTGGEVEGPSLVIRALLADWNVRIAAVGVAAVQLFLFWREWVASGLWRRSEPAIEMGRPYGRIFVMQFAVIFGAWAMLSMNLPAGMVLILCAGKTLIELFPPRIGKRPGETNFPE